VPRIAKGLSSRPLFALLPPAPSSSRELDGMPRPGERVPEDLAACPPRFARAGRFGVVVASAWPRRCGTVGMSTPAAISVVTEKWRKSWMRRRPAGPVGESATLGSVARQSLQRAAQRESLGYRSVEGGVTDPRRSARRACPADASDLRQPEAPDGQVDVRQQHGAELASPARERERDPMGAAFRRSFETERTRAIADARHPVGAPAGSRSDG